MYDIINRCYALSRPASAMAEMTVLLAIMGLAAWAQFSLLNRMRSDR